MADGLVGLGQSTVRTISVQTLVLINVFDRCCCAIRVLEVEAWVAGDEVRRCGDGNSGRSFGGTGRRRE